MYIPHVFFLLCEGLLAQGMLCDWAVQPFLLPEGVSITYV